MVCILAGQTKTDKNTVRWRLAEYRVFVVRPAAPDLRPAPEEDRTIREKILSEGRTGDLVMPRRRTRVVTGLSLFLVAPVVSRAVIDHGEEIEWIEAKREQNHFYTVRIRTRPVNREYQSRLAKVQAGTGRRGA